jgi:type IV pilus assembly protein PilA
MGSLSIEITDKRKPRMLKSLTERRNRDEEGFTLIELMVVVLIIAILLAIAIPTFLGARERANDRAAQSSLRNALTAAKTMYTDSQNYTTATAASLQVIEPSLSFQTSASTDFKQVQVVPGSATLWSAAALSKSGVCFVISDTTSTSGGTWYAKKSGDNASCQVSDAVPTASTQW